MYNIPRPNLSTAMNKRLPKKKPSQRFEERGKSLMAKF